MKKNKKPNKFVEFFRRWGVYVVAGAMVLAIGLTFGITALVNSGTDDVVDVGTNRMQFSMPMSNPTILKEYSSTALQRNDTLAEWSAHLAIDMTSDDKNVYCVLDGTVSEVYYKYETGNTVVITHANGLVSYYSSLADDVLVKKGDKIKGGTQLGQASASCGDELLTGEHLHFYMTLDGKKVDPNNYLDLENK